MQLSRNKTAAIMIATLLIVSMGASTVLISSVTAHTPSWQLVTNAYVAANPNPIGVGQSTTIYMWLNRVFDSALMGNDYRFHNYKLEITAPNGKTSEKIFANVADSTSNQGYSFTPDQVGDYNLTFIFPGNNINDFSHSASSAYVNDTFMPSNATMTLTVQQDAISYLPTAPLPTEYWARPIYGENPNWWAISSNWLGTGAPNYGGFAAGGNYNSGGNGELVYPGDAVGPQTSHIMWTKPLQNGGVVGGNNFAIQGDTFFEGSAYSQRYSNPIIVNGKLYYTEPVQFTGTTSGPTDCVDLRTGKLLWSRNDVPGLSFAYIYDVQDPNQHGVYPAILCTANFARCFDADTGDPLFNVTGVPTASLQMQKVNGPQGEQLRYYMSNMGNATVPKWTLSEWNSSKLFSWAGNSPALTNASNNAGWSMTGSVNNPMGSPGAYVSQAFVVDGSISNPALSTCRNDWNVSIPWRDTMPNSPTIVYCAYNDIMLCYNGTLPSQGAMFMGTLGFSPYTYFAIDLNPAHTTLGQILWMKNYDPPAGNLTVLFAGVDPVNRVFTENLRETMNFVGYNLDTGARLWTSTPQATMDYYGSPASGSISNAFAYGKLYSSAYAGVVYCYDTSTGKTLWTFGNGAAPNNSTNSGFEVPGHYPTFVNAIGNGIVYVVTTEHTPETPIYKGAVSRALNATDGTQLWTLSSYVGEFSAMSYAIADGYANWFNGYDNQIYTVGRGPTQLTVQAPAIGIDLSKSIVITGRVSDISAGTKQDEQAMRFPNGVPCANDAVMGEWMGYLYQQQVKPTNFLGVDVSLDVVDANGNYRNIGTATTDASGTFNFKWTPDIEGKYTLIASFKGTNGYWPSSDETAFTVDSVAPTVPPAATAAPSMADLYFVPATAGLFIAVIVGIALMLLVLRKRP